MLPRPAVRPRKARIVYSAAGLTLVDLSDEATTEGLMLLVSSFGVKAALVDDLTPCFDLAQLRVRNETLAKKDRL